MSFFPALFLSELWAASPSGMEEHAASAIQLIYPLINFLIFAYLVNRFLLPPVKSYLRSRRKEILTAVEEAGEGKRRAEEAVRDYRTRMGRLAEEVRRVQDEWRADGEKEKAKILKEAEESASNIKTDAAFLAEQETKQARQELRAEMARLSQAAARKLVQGQMTPADQKRLVEEFLSGVERG